MHNGQQGWYRPISLTLFIWLSIAGSMLLFYCLTQLTKQSHIYISILSIYGSVGFMFLDFPCTRLRPAISFSSPALYYIWLLIWLYSLLISQCHEVWQMSGVLKHPWSNCMWMPYSNVIYYVNEFTCICNFDLVSFVYFFSVLHRWTTVNHWLFYLLQSVVSLLTLFSSEYASRYGTEATAIYSSYVSIPSLSGLWTVCPDLVLVISHIGVFVLMSTTLDLSVTVVWVVQSSFLVTPFAGHASLLSGRGLFLLHPLWGLISCHIGGVLPLFFPPSLCTCMLSCVTSIMQSHTHCLGDPFASACTACINKTSNHPVAFPCFFR